MKKSLKNLINVALILVLFVAVYVVQSVADPTSILFTVLKKGMIYALIAVSMNLLNGFTGLFSLGQAGFMLVGAYVYGIFTIPLANRANVYQYYDGGLIQFTLPVIVAILLGGLVAVVLAYLIGLPVLKLKSDYLAIATLGFAEIVRAIIQYDKLGPITNGSNLLRKFPNFSTIKLNIFGNQIDMDLLFPFIAVTICIAVVVLLINSTYGRAFKAIRDDEIAAEAMGINLAHHKRLAFVISSFFAGVGGALLAMYQGTVQANAFKSAMTYEILLIVVIGGIGSVTGSVIASFLYICCSEWWLRFLDNDTFITASAKPFITIGSMQYSAPQIVVFAIAFVLSVAVLSAIILAAFKKKDKAIFIKAKFVIIIADIALLAWLSYFTYSVFVNGSSKLPFLKSGFRMVVFSAIIMIVVLFFRTGIMGDKEFSVEKIYKFYKSKKDKKLSASAKEEI